MPPAPQADELTRSSTTSNRALSRFGLALAKWSERWFPDPLVFAFLGILVVFTTGLLLRKSSSRLATA